MSTSLALTLALLLPGQAAAPPGGASAGTFPSLELTAHDGSVVRTADWKGKVVLLDFWATWCGPCRTATPHLERIASTFVAEPFLLVGINVDEDDEAFRAFLKEFEISWTQIRDPEAKLTKETFGVGNFPTYLVLDHEGRLAYRTFGWSASKGPTLTARLRGYLHSARAAAAD